MKLISRALLTAAIVAMPTAAQAQYDITLTVNAQTIPAAGGGGQFSASATTLGDILAYCIDPFRNIAGFGNPATYRVFTFGEYVAFAAAANPASLFPNSAFLTELRQFALNAGTISLGTGVAADDAQNQTWNWFGAAGNQGGPGAPITGEDNWRVLVSVDAINARDIAGYQTMITSVPEPSTYVLMFSGLALVGIAARRRKVS